MSNLAVRPEHTDADPTGTLSPFPCQLGVSFLPSSLVWYYASILGNIQSVKCGTEDKCASRIHSVPQKTTSSDTSQS